MGILHEYRIEDHEVMAKGGKRDDYLHLHTLSTSELHCS
jgi:hypothetical protein